MIDPVTLIVALITVRDPGAAGRHRRAGGGEVGRAEPRRRGDE